MPIDDDDRMRWAETLAVRRIHGEGGAAWIAERIAKLTLKGDDAGVARFKEIEQRYELLLSGAGGPR